MALTLEQRALLELAHDRNLSDEEIAELTGAGPEEVRRRLEDALAARSAFRRRRLGGAVAALALAIAGLAIAGVFGGDDGPAGDLAPAPEAGDDPVASIELDGDQGAGGTAAIGVDADGSPYFELELARVPPAAPGTVHMLWIEIERGRGLPLPDPVAIGEDGTFAGRFALPLELATIFEAGSALELVATDRPTIERIARQIGRARALSRRGELDPAALPRRPGAVVVRGAIAS